ncbi:MAG: OB-fold domain-containing protein [Proteobacteria bacterium]|nr:OB-fold domain-containing protein [Pseudomonadota bacterium]HQR03363.1 OB-fold domain-containing protein [Rhodocyclaceae bacterium]
MTTDRQGSLNASRPAAPAASGDSAFFWAGADRGELLAQSCADCGRLRHPPRPMCPHCHGTGCRVVALSGRGTVYSWIVAAHPAPHGFDAPPVVVLVELEEGVRIVSNIEGVPPERMCHGLPVMVAFVPAGEGRQVPVFRPRSEEGCAP